jgi:hypothetical protein
VAHHVSEPASCDFGSIQATHRGFQPDKPGALYELKKSGGVSAAGISWLNHV